MDFKTFEALINKHKEVDSVDMLLYNNGVDISEIKHNNFIDYMFKYIIEKEFGDVGYDYVIWWLYDNIGDDKNGERIITVTDANDSAGKVNQINLTKLEDLYNFINKYK